MEQSWSLLYSSSIYNYLCNRCLSVLKLWVWIPLMEWYTRYNITLCDKVCQWLVTGRWFSANTLVSSTNKTDCHDITEIELKVVLNIITLTLTPDSKFCSHSSNYIPHAAYCKRCSYQHDLHGHGYPPLNRGITPKCKQW